MSWTTEAEINFVSKIGNFNGTGVAPRDPLKCIEGYVSSFDNRVYWGKVDKEEVRPIMVERYRQLKAAAGR